MLKEFASKFSARDRLYIVVILLMVLPAVLMLLYIKAYGVNVVIWDKWAMVPLFDKLYTGDSSLWADLWAPINNHRVFFPKLTILLLGSITHWNNVAEMYLHWFFSCLTSYVLLRAYIRTFGSSVPALALFIPVVWIIFWMRPYRLVIGEGDIVMFMGPFFLLLALYLLVTSGSLGWRFALSVISGVVASFSYGIGPLVWPIGLVLILLFLRLRIEESKRLYLKMASIWCLIGIPVLIGYFAGNTVTEPGGRSLLSFLDLPSDYLLKFFLASMGGPLSRDLNIAIAMGSLLLFLFIGTGLYALRKYPRPQSFTLFFLSLILLAILFAAQLTVVRSITIWGRHIEEALASRYTEISSFGIIGLYLLILSLQIRYKYVKPLLIGFLLSLIVMGMYAPYSSAIELGNKVRDRNNEIAYFVSTYEYQSDENLRKVHPYPEQVRERAPILEKYNLSVFSKTRLEPEKLALVEGSTLSGIDFINDRRLAQLDTPIIINAQDEKTITISGWAVDQKAGRAAGGVFVNVDGQIDIPTLYGLDHQSVVDVFKNSRYRYSGFWASIGTSVLGEGEHTLSLKIVTADKKGHYKAEQEIILEVR